MYKLIFIGLLLMFTNNLLATDKDSTKMKDLSKLTLGIRSTASLFDHNDYVGLGYGGHFRLRVADKVNTEWFADYIKTDIGGLGFRETYHIGWSVLLYLTEQKGQKLSPYLAGGHCFDHAIVSANRDENGVRESVKRWTSAVQGGIGTHYHFSRNFNLTFSALYMTHLGKDIHVEIAGAEHDEHEHEENNEMHGKLIINEDNSAPALEGHLLLSVSINYRFSKL
jgi:hypothetical protein